MEQIKSEFDIQQQGEALLKARGFSLFNTLCTKLKFEETNSAKESRIGPNITK